jgi:hypothetical protein
MVENLDKVLERGGKIEVIATKAQQLATSSLTYKQNVSLIPCGFPKMHQKIHDFDMNL